MWKSLADREMTVSKRQTFRNPGLPYIPLVLSLVILYSFTRAVRRGQGGKGKEWTNCVQSDIRAFSILGDWKATAIKAEVWIWTVTEGGRRFMAARRGEEIDATRYRQEKSEATGLGKLLSHTKE